MKTEENRLNDGNGRMESDRPAGRVIARIGAARILRQPDDSLVVSSESSSDRNAALAWMFAVNPTLVSRVRRCAG